MNNMFKTTTFSEFTNPTATKQIDFTGDKTDEIQIEVMIAAGGHQVLYIHANGETIVRLCRPKNIEIIDRRRYETQN